MPPPVKLKGLPAQITGVLLLAVATGLILTVTEVVAVEVQLLALVTIRVYVPDIETVALVMVGLLSVTVNELGPLHA